MTKEEFLKYSLPDNPGVYTFMHGKDILYIGKATSLKERVRSYFSSDLSTTRGQLIVDMVLKSNHITYEETDSVLEALILEAFKIKKYQPYYNTKEKDNKSFTYVVITKEDFERVLLVRGRNLEQDYPHNDRRYTFGPFPNTNILKSALKIIRKIFPYRDNCQVNNSLSSKPCFNFQIGLCPGVCGGKIDKKQYQKTIKHLKTFFEGKKAKLLKDLEREMLLLAKNKKFEEAQKIKKQIFSLNHIQDISLIKKDIESNHLFSEKMDINSEDNFRIEAYDVAHMSGKNMVGVMVVVQNGETENQLYRKFKIKTVKQVNDIASLKEILKRRFKHHEWQFPNLIVVDGGLAQYNAASEFIKSLNLSIPIVSVVKNESHKPEKMLGDEDLIKKHQNAILLANSEAHRFSITYHRKLRKKIL